MICCFILSCHSTSFAQSSFSVYLLIHLLQLLLDILSHSGLFIPYVGALFIHLMHLFVSWLHLLGPLPPFVRHFGGTVVLNVCKERLE